MTHLTHLEVAAVPAGVAALVAWVFPHQPWVTGQPQGAGCSRHVPAAEVSAPRDIIHPVHADKDEALRVCQRGPGHEIHLDVRAPGPAVIIQQEGCGLGVTRVVGSGEVNNIVPESQLGDMQINV